MCGTPTQVLAPKSDRWLVLSASGSVQIRGQLTLEGQGVPDDPVKLPPGYLACLSCGVAVPYPVDEQDVVRVNCYGKEGKWQPSTALPTVVAFTRCADCSRRHELAVRVVAETNNLSHRFRPDSAVKWLSCALDGLAVLGQGPAPIANPNPSELTEDEAVRLIAHLSTPGTAARWETRLVPYSAPDANAHTCSKSPWAHVKMGQRSALRDGYAAMLRRRVAANAPPVKISPPTLTAPPGAAGNEVAVNSGCMFCGVGYQLMSADQVEQVHGTQHAARELWKLKRATAQVLGGKISPQMLVGHLCVLCNEAVTHTGALGPSALERALVSALWPEGLGRLPYGNFEVNGLIGWGALVARARQHPSATDPKPNSQPWEHLGELTVLSSEIGAVMG
jgi:hypothetical protein